MSFPRNLKSAGEEAGPLKPSALFQLFFLQNKKRPEKRIQAFRIVHGKLIKKHAALFNKKVLCGSELKSNLTRKVIIILYSHLSVIIQ